jgi:hypothetical protein
MADNSSLPVASGNETFANDEIGGVKYPRPKINWGPDGTANDVDVANGKPLPVQLRSPTGVAPVVAAASTAAVATDTALVVAISPNGQNQNGRTAAGSSAPVVLSTEDKASLDSIASGMSVFRSLDLDETEEEVKATAGTLHKLRLTNRTTSVRYVKLYNATAANVTVGTTTPIDTIVLPGGTSADLCTVVTESFGGGLTFGTALCLACTTGLADNDTGAPGANDVVATAYYK